MSTSLDLLQRLFIGPDGFDLMCEIARHISADSLQAYISIITFYEAHKMSLHFLQHIIAKEIASNANGTMFRGNSFPTRCLAHYTTMTNAPNIVATLLREPMEDLLATPDESLEINPEFATAPIAQAVEALKHRVTTFVAKLTETAEAWPAAYRFIGNCIRTKCEELHAPRPHVCVAGFLILRVVCPALLQPHKSGFCTERPSDATTRSLVVICKIIQCIANNTIPHEPHMQCLIGFILEQTQAMNEAMRRFSQERPAKFVFCPVKKKALERSITDILGIWHNSAACINEYLQTSTPRDFHKLALAVLKYSKKMDSKRKSAVKQKLKEEARITALFFAAKAGDVDATLGVLRKRKELIDCTDLDMMTPLHYACLNAHEALALVLLQNNACLFLQDNMGFTPLHYACMQNITTVLQLVINNKFPYVSLENEEGNTCLHYLVRHPFTTIHEEFLSFITKQDPDIINTPNHADETPLHLAVISAIIHPDFGHSTILFLLERGADPSLRNAHNQQPFDIAEEQHRDDILSLRASTPCLTPTIPKKSVTPNPNALKAHSRRSSLNLFHRPSSLSPRSLAGYQSNMQASLSLQ